MSGTRLFSLNSLAREDSEIDVQYLRRDAYSESSSASGVSSNGPCSQLFHKLAKEKIRLRRIESELDKAKSSPQAAERTKEISAKLQETLSSAESHFDAALNELASGVELLDQTCVRLAGEARELKEQRLKVFACLDERTGLEARLDRIEQFEMANVTRLQRLEETLSQRRPLAVDYRAAEAKAEAAAANEKVRELTRMLQDKDYDIYQLGVNSFEDSKARLENFRKVQQLEARLREKEAENAGLVKVIEDGYNRKHEFREQEPPQKSYPVVPRSLDDVWECYDRSDNSLAGYVRELEVVESQKPETPGVKAYCEYRSVLDRPPTPFREATSSECRRDKWQVINRLTTSRGKDGGDAVVLSQIPESSPTSDMNEEQAGDIWIGIAQDCSVEPLTVAALPQPKSTPFLAAAPAPPILSLGQLETRIDEAIAELNLISLKDSEDLDSTDTQFSDCNDESNSNRSSDYDGVNELLDDDDDEVDEDDNDNGLGEWYVHNLCQQCFDGLCDDCINKLYHRFVDELCPNCTDGLCETCEDESVEVQDGVSLTGAQLLHLAELGKAGFFASCEW